MIGALFYLLFTSWKNRLLWRIRRLKQPKYLVGAIVGAGYFYFFFLRPTFVLSGGPAGAGQPDGRFRGLGARAAQRPGLRLGPQQADVRRRFRPYH